MFDRFIKDGFHQQNWEDPFGNLVRYWQMNTGKKQMIMGYHQPASRIFRTSQNGTGSNKHKDSTKGC